MASQPSAHPSRCKSESFAFAIQAIDLVRIRSEISAEVASYSLPWFHAAFGLKNGGILIFPLKTSKRHFWDARSEPGEGLDDSGFEFGYRKARSTMFRQSWLLFHHQDLMLKLLKILKVLGPVAELIHLISHLCAGSPLVLFILVTVS